jgi:hypothetical protein
MISDKPRQLRWQRHQHADGGRERSRQRDPEIIYVGIPIEDVRGAPIHTTAQLFHAGLKLAGLVANQRKCF